MRVWNIVYGVVCIVSLFITPQKVRATGEFREAYDVQYAVAPTGVTIVTQNVTLTNNQTNLYPQKYSIVIDSTKIKNVIAYDNGGVIRPQISQTDGKTEIALQFNEKNVGLGKSLRFSLRYENTDIAQKNGSIWELNIPGVADNPDLSDYVVSLSVPPTFGPNAYMSPPPQASGKWTKEQMIKGGISAAYGVSQQFNATLSYYVENPTVTSKTMEIALPPDTAFQKVAIISLDPKPMTVLKDKDGNWLAQYSVGPSKKLSITATLSVRIYMHPRENFDSGEIDTDLYTKPLKYWESNDAHIEELAALYNTPRAIYDYVTQTLTYDYARVNKSPIRKGALQSLASPQSSVCMEFTDLFIAIARAAGIPAREAVGYAYTTNAKLRPLSLATDVLHSWPEYYDTAARAWIPVDPTWADTTGGVNYFDKLDFNHIVFSYYGASSDYPYPAGFYKKAGSSTKDITVQFADALREEKEGTVGISYMFPSSVTSGFTASGSVVIENISEVAMKRLSATVQSTPVDVALTIAIPDLPPYARYSIPVSFHVPNFFSKNFGMIVTTVGEQSKRFDFTIVPLLYSFSIPIIGLAIGIGVLVYIGIRIHKWKQ